MMQKNIDKPDQTNDIDSIESAKDCRPKDEETRTIIANMFSGTDERIRLKCNNDLVGVIIDRFGKDVMIMPVDDQHFLTHVNVTVSPQFFGWLAALGDLAKIISPAHVRESYQAHIIKIAAHYN